MRVLAFAGAALALIAATPASAQSGRPIYDDDRSGPPRYYTGRPPDQPREEFDRPRPWPSVRGPANAERRPEPSYRRTRQDAPSDNYRRFWDEGNDRRNRTTVARPAPAPRQSGPAPREAPPVREPAPERESDRGPVARVAVGADQMVISIAEYQSLQNQARELNRLLGTRRDFHDERSFQDGRDPRDNRDFGNDRPGPRSGSVEVYR